MLKFRQTLLAVVSVAVLAGRGAAQQPTTITGHVSRDDGSPLAGATIAIPSLGLGTTSRADGSYGFLIPTDRVQGQTVAVTARAIGFKPQTVDVALAEGSLTQDFALPANPLQLGEIVVTGAGTVSEVEKLGSVRNSIDSSLISRSD